jgi:cell division protein FtsL
MGRILLFALVGALLLSAMGVVFSTHESRKQFVALQGLQKTRDDLNAEWGRLQLEQSTWATHGRIEQFANNRLDMVNPSAGTVVIVRP